MASRSKGSASHNRRMTSYSDADKMRVLGAVGNSNVSQDYQAVPLSTSYLNSGTQNSCHGNHSGVPPPLPPRPDMCRQNRYSNYNNYYSPYSRFSPGMYSPAYGGCRTPYNRYGMSHDSYNSFIQLAEESTRPAFESIESVVDIVGSISMMLESTYHAVYSSYNAILGVVDQFARLRDHLAQVLSFLALLRGLRYLCLKVLYLLRLKKDNPSIEAAWNRAKSASEHSDISSIHENEKSPWPFFMFIGIVVGAPWLMFKLLAKNVAKKPFDISSWKGKNGYTKCIGNYDFRPTRQGELSFRAGETLYLAPQNLQTNVPRGWLLASSNKKIGLIPVNYLKTVDDPVQRLPRAANTPVIKVTPKADAVAAADAKSSDMPEQDINPFASADDPSANKDESCANKDESCIVSDPSCTEESITENPSGGEN